MSVSMVIIVVIAVVVVVVVRSWLVMSHAMHAAVAAAIVHLVQLIA